MPCKKVYPTLKANIQHFVSTKIIKYIQIYLIDECIFDNYPFFLLIIFWGEIIKLYLQQGNFLQNLMSALNKETKVTDCRILLFSFFSQRRI